MVLRQWKYYDWLQRQRHDWLRVHHYALPTQAELHSQTEAQAEAGEKLDSLHQAVVRIHLRMDTELRSALNETEWRMGAQVNRACRKLQNQNDAHQTEIRRLWALVDTPAKFPRFLELSRELRDMIWELATPGRTIVVGQYHLTYLPPVTAQVNRESRSVACRRGKLLQLAGTSMVPAHGGSVARRNIRRRWFDPSRDTLLLPAQLQPHVEVYREFFKVAQHVGTMSDAQLVKDDVAA
ncbi:Uu.00g125160.m01.CDS01 [Anthostomella pinea]|uniref:Uu.00g125160.m01.CDS01 n=1 Tax=Anthostomella pinea TaxID=933095 RepID=A0AAI8VCF2_9PEZI|nr:Uu.00g125160.m01.CDS01 [Anthostomella pinea]